MRRDPLCGDAAIGPAYHRKARMIESSHNLQQWLKIKTDLNRALPRSLNNACQKWGARELRLRYLPKPSLNRWIAEALIDHHSVNEKIRADIPAGELTLQDVLRVSELRATVVPWRNFIQSLCVSLNIQ